MTKKLLICTIMLLLSHWISCQVTFHTSGGLKYERKINAFRLTEGSWMNRMFEKVKFQVDTFELSFDSVQSIYTKSVKEDDESGGGLWFSMSVAPDKSNIVYKDLKADSLMAIRDLFEETITIEDSMRSIQWKITGESREILGFECHKAVGILYDSLYIVAFYTDQILPPNGPETFGGLPGTILGLAIPRLYTTWMAISFEPLKSNDIIKPKIPNKKKALYNWNSYHNIVSERFKDWGEPYSKLFVWMWAM